MAADRYCGERLGTTDSELIFYLLFREGLESDPAGALMRGIGNMRKVPSSMRP
jgi:hypothetical protein